MRKGLLIILLFAVTGLVYAQEQAPPPPGAEGSEVPAGGGSESIGPGVAHLSLIRGDVSMQRGDSGDWVATSLNTPIVSGDAVATSAGSRAEVQLDYADVLRLSGQSQAKVADMARNHIQVQVGQGLASVSLFQGGQADVEIDTPNVAIHPTKNGRYDIEVNSDSETSLIVRDGEAEVSTPQGGTTVREGEIINIRGTDDPEYKVSEAPGPDDWDRWNVQRDNVILTAQNAPHTNRYYTGTQDLDAYGHWVNVPDYGYAWTPYEQPASWAPYQAGRWVWEPYYGWTWVSYEPWGWAPYHYGRWFYWGSGWYWWPGPVTPAYYPAWGPAFVGFIGFGAHIGFGFGFGTIGWFPLFPFEPFHPWWGFGFNRFGAVAFGGRPFGGRGFLAGAFANERLRAGITTVAAGNFGRGPASFGHGVDAATLRGAHLANGNLGIMPTRESLASTNRGFRSAPGGFRNTASSRFVSRSQPSMRSPSFREETSRLQSAMRANGLGGQSGERGQTGTGFGRTGGGDRSGFGNSAGRFGNEGRTTNQTFGGNERGTNNSNAGRGGFSGNQSRGGTFDNRGGMGGTRNDRPSSATGGGARPQLDLSKRIVVPRSGSYGGRNSTSGSNGAYRPQGYSGARTGNYGAYSNPGARGGSYSGSNGAARGGNFGGYSAGRGGNPGGYSAGRSGNFGGNSGGGRSYSSGRSGGGSYHGGSSSGGHSGGSSHGGGGGGHSGGGHR